MPNLKTPLIVLAAMAVGALLAFVALGMWFASAMSQMF